ncbi:hypothetical protein Nepgr_002848 [Nepenthes gracilis]|uniref:Pseudouridine synthase I TruA alpha/beta domain-containing protein n=1 Tax=Nepenthes gracilis TaxID=150966 RepID=A0AAD3RY27_NEPGR|nr:hypothetical protein Nepgr_002848 [Nepenthes gracilis]
MANQDDIATLHSQLDCLRSRVKELEIENAKLISKLSECHCCEMAKLVDSIAGNGGFSMDQSKQFVKDEGSRTRKTSLEGHSLSMHHLPRRYVALRVMYFGKRFYGFASEAHMEPTVESELFKAFEKTRLLVGEKKAAKYSRCGRTDKGVSAVGQVICLYLRSNVKETSESNTNSTEEIDYVRLLNNVLPKDIRITGWCPAPLDFNARFSCLMREYKYFFWRENLDLSAMEIAGKKFLGEHDFRNFCKMDALNVHNYRRRVISFEITPCSERFEGSELWAINIRGTAFLWHQVRCMVSVLFMIGQGLESVNVIDTLLNIESSSRKPQYTMAPDNPLVLQSCVYDGLQFSTSPDARRALHVHLENERLSHILQAAIFHEAMHTCLPIDDGGRSPNMAQTKKKTSHVPLMARPTEPSYEERRSKLSLRSLNQNLAGLFIKAETD